MNYCIRKLESNRQACLYEGLVDEQAETITQYFRGEKRLADWRR